jgi:hypothetical protein
MQVEAGDPNRVNQLTRRRVVGTGAKLAYAAPLVAASFHLTQLNALADGTCGCMGIAGGTFDATPYGGGGPSCCTCEQCKSVRPGQPNGSVLYPTAFYNAEKNLCADDDFKNGFSDAYCAPICTPCGISR